MHAYETASSGDILSRLTNDLNLVRNFAASTVPSLINSGLTPLVTFAYLVQVNWRLTLIMTVVSPLLLWLGGKLSRPITQLSQELQEGLARLNVLAQESTTGSEIIRAHQLETLFNQRFQEQANLTVDRTKQVARQRATLIGLQIATSLAPVVACLCLGTYLILRGGLTPGGLMAFSTQSNSLTRPLGNIQGLLATIRQELAAAERVEALLGAEQEQSSGTVQTGDPAQPLIQFCNVSFRYPNREAAALENVSLQVQPGEHIAIVGGSGSGKSTLFKLLLGLYPGYSGSVHLLGHSLRDWDLTALRRQIAIVTQDAHLFPGTIRENIAYGRPDASETEIIQAAMQANAHEFILTLADGYDTQVGELGGRLSGGQRQRIAIARAFLADAALLLLDEPTSALDAASALVIQQTLHRLMVGRTVLMITHRLAATRTCDRILVFGDGRLLEEGSYEQLLGQGGAFAELQRNAEREAM